MLCGRICGRFANVLASASRVLAVFVCSWCCGALRVFDHTFSWSLVRMTSLCTHSKSYRVQQVVVQVPGKPHTFCFRQNGLCIFAQLCLCVLKFNDLFTLFRVGCDWVENVIRYWAMHRSVLRMINKCSPSRWSVEAATSYSQPTQLSYSRSWRKHFRWTCK